MDISDIKSDLAVHAKGKGQIDTLGAIVGRVEQLEGDNYIKVKGNDWDEHAHHWIPLDWIEMVDTKAVYLNKTEAQIRANILHELPAKEQSQEKNPWQQPGSHGGPSND